MRESDVESSLRRRVQDGGGECYKFVSPNRIGVPDRLCLYPVPPQHQKIVAQYVQFVETKAPGKKPMPWQAREHKRMRDMGFSVEVLDNRGDYT